jgi:formate hydrogenlyase subunit 4
MLNFVLLNIGQDATSFFAGAVDAVNKVRAESPILKVLLWPLSYALLICKVLCKTTTAGTTRFVYEEIPAMIKHSGNRLYSRSANSLYCFSKVGLAIFFIDLYCFIYMFNRFQIKRRVNRRWVLYPYIVTKIFTILMPLMFLTTTQRLPFWFIIIPFAVFECFLGVFFILSIGFGINFELDHFYHHWPKHYRYKRASGNRQLFVELSIYVYIVSKFLILFDYICNDLETSLFRLEFPHELTHGGVGIDFDVLNALVEPDTVANLRYGVLFLLALSSLGVYSIILAGWSSNSKYAFIGALRSAAQMISYEVAISLIILPIVVMAGSLNLTMITHIQSITTWFVWPLLPVSILFLIAMLAETNRTPFDLPEAEAELVAGYNVDYSSLPFAMFFLGEYCNMILISTVYCLFFLGGGLNGLGLPSAVILAAKAAVTWVFFVIVRATLPRYRYDQLMDIGWKVFLPISGSFLLFAFGILVYFDALPVANELPLVSSYLAAPFLLAQSAHPLVAAKTTIKPQILQHPRRAAMLFITTADTFLPEYFIPPLFFAFWGYYLLNYKASYVARVGFPRLSHFGCIIPTPVCIILVLASPPQMDPGGWLILYCVCMLLIVGPSMYALISARDLGAFDLRESVSITSFIEEHTTLLMAPVWFHLKWLIRKPVFSEFGAGVLAYIYFYAPCALLPVVVTNHYWWLPCGPLFSLICVLTPVMFGSTRRSAWYAALRANWQRRLLDLTTLSLPVFIAQILFGWTKLFSALATTAPQLNGQLNSVITETYFCAVRWIWDAATTKKGVADAVEWHLSQRTHLSAAQRAHIQERMAVKMPELIARWQAGFPREATAELVRLLTAFEKEALTLTPVSMPIGWLEWASDFLSQVATWF